MSPATSFLELQLQTVSEMRPPGRGAAWYGCYFEEDRAVLVCRYVVLC